LGSPPELILSNYTEHFFGLNRPDTPGRCAIRRKNNHTLMLVNNLKIILISIAYDDDECGCRGSYLFTTGSSQTKA
jgi:hypothetical protein